MDFCSQLHAFPRLGLVFAAMALAVSASERSSGSKPVGSARVRSVVRADPRTGRLVRTTVISPAFSSPKPVVSAGGAVDPAVRSADPAVLDIVERTALKYELDPLLVHSVIEVESNYNPYAISPKGAQGIMQLMPGTARRFGVRNAFDVRENIEGGAKYLRFLQNQFPNDPRLAIAAYNAGEGAVWKYNNNVPPYRETEQYVHKVGQRYGKAKKALDQKKAASKPTTTGEPRADTVPEPQYAHVVRFVDESGRLHLRTEQASNP